MICPSRQYNTYQLKVLKLTKLNIVIKYLKKIKMCPIFYTGVLFRYFFCKRKYFLHKFSVYAWHVIRLYVLPPSESHAARSRLHGVRRGSRLGPGGPRPTQFSFRPPSFVADILGHLLLGSTFFRQNNNVCKNPRTCYFLLLNFS